MFRSIAQLIPSLAFGGEIGGNTKDTHPTKTQYAGGIMNLSDKDSSAKGNAQDDVLRGAAPLL